MSLDSQMGQAALGYVANTLRGRYCLEAWNSYIRTRMGDIWGTYDICCQIQASWKFSTAVVLKHSLPQLCFNPLGPDSCSNTHLISSIAVAQGSQALHVQANLSALFPLGQPGFSYVDLSLLGILFTH